jgi:hypothetical protein
LSDPCYLFKAKGVAVLSTQSSAAMAFRGLVMLGCLVVIPAAALFGTQLPDLAKQVLQQQFGVSTASAAPTGSEAPPFATTAATVPASAAIPATPNAAPPPSVVPAVEPSLQSQFQVAPIARPTPAPASPLAMSMAPTSDASPTTPFPGAAPVGNPAQVDSAVLPAAFNTPMPMAGGPVSAPPVRTSAPTTGTHSEAVAPATGFNLPQPAAPVVATETPMAAASQPPLSAAVPERFVALQQRLRELGATYFLLESWGAQGQLYRFYCKIAIGGNTNYTRYFEATDSEPLAAMNKVVQQIEAWRAGRP